MRQVTSEGDVHWGLAMTGLDRVIEKIHEALGERHRRNQNPIRGSASGLQTNGNIWIFILDTVTNSSDQAGQIGDFKGESIRLKLRARHAMEHLGAAVKFFAGCL